MSMLQRVSQSCDRSACDSLIIGILGALVTALIHYTITISPHFDFLIRDVEFYAVIAAVILVGLVAVLGLGTGLNALHHLREPHGRFAKPLAIAGITLDLAVLLPAALILVIAIETFFLKFIDIQYAFPE
jgi:hypothetical protein